MASAPPTLTQAAAHGGRATRRFSGSIAARISGRSNCAAGACGCCQHEPGGDCRHGGRLQDPRGCVERVSPVGGHAHQRARRCAADDRTPAATAGTAVADSCRAGTRTSTPSPTSSPGSGHDPRTFAGLTQLVCVLEINDGHEDAG
jgi:hypothetical protein